MRIQRAALSALHIHHVTSAIDLSIAIPEGIGGASLDDVVTGYTEWAGLWRNANVSIGWDWGVVRDVIVVLNPAEIRTNIHLIGENGHVESSLLARVHFLEYIESLPWRDIAISGLLVRRRH